ncbi:hypothetical protein IU433_25090 [Nocardia puris]|uniref:hypothetical protein n=1 Tax=Nocardia puris TaxID=208602 RepID=UPI00189532F4|nr:hypothetical protein [Nocardia puris]MBF6213411.1 hypothetical protein [Nocardia puris]MBF6369420.1 hypothetical protein [Nocardia puris]MBF6462291.1 hypothetical protein [Nocardia puris]
MIEISEPFARKGIEDESRRAWIAALNALRSTRFTELMLGPDPKRRARRLLTLYSDAAGLDVDHVRRWMQAGLVGESFWGRRHGDPAWLVDATDRLAVALT